MDTTRLERFAKYARRYLMEQVEKKLIQILVYTAEGKASEQRRVYQDQVRALEAEIDRVCHVQIADGTTKIDTKPMQELIEKVAYTWFNRFCALRFMDVNGYNKVNVISPLPGHFQPEILEEAKAGHIDEMLVHTKYRTLVFDLLSGKQTHPDQQSEAYRILIRSVCNYYADTMPFLFERIDDWTELLMPDDLLSGNSILAYTREAMVPGVCKDVEVIGWLYQYYIAEKKSEVQEGVKKGKKVQSKDIPAVTQLFTPHWIVKYMVQNSLGRLWMDTRPNSRLVDKMEYYVKPESDSNSKRSNGLIEISSPEEIKFCDPCCGSGHILTYAFDLLFEIYSEEGYSPTEIPKLIIENNLFGIEIDERAAELSALALTMKARERDKLWLSRKIEPQICCLENISFNNDEIDPYMDRCGRDVFTINFERILSQFEHADTFGSLIVPAEQDIEAISETLNTKDFRSDVFLAPTHKKVLKLLKQANYLSTKFQVVVTNPPYMGKGMSDKLSKYLSDNYQDVKSDLFSAFVFRCAELAKNKAYIGIMSPNVWMYISSYEKLRKWIIAYKSLTNLIELPLSGFTGATVQICAYNFINKSITDQYGGFIRLVRFKGGDDEMASYAKQAIANPDCSWFYRRRTLDFTKIPGTPIAYWINISSDLWKHTIRNRFSSGGRMKTHNNECYLRFVWEVSKDNNEWLLYCNGGDFRKYSGNIQTLIDWSKNAQNHYTEMGGMYNRKFESMVGITWSLITSSKSSFRVKPNYALYSSGSPTIFSSNDDVVHPTIAFLNSPIATYLLEAINPTLNTTVSDVLNLPDIQKVPLKVTNNVIECLRLSDKDWDSYETSWDFQQLHLLVFRCEGLGVRECYAKLREQWIEHTLTMQGLEEENNRIFIDACGLKGVKEPKVPLREITLTCNPYYRYGKSNSDSDNIIESSLDNSWMNPECDMGNNQEITKKDELVVKDSKQFPINPALEERLRADTMKDLISYAVGCMFGRYSLDKPGLILANQGETVEDYLKQVSNPSFIPDKDNVIPVLEGEWFDDDIVNRFHAFLKIAFGADHFSQNVNYIEEAIGKDLRTYLVKDFYNDHVKRYKTRPIYWLFSSPKGSFNALIYMHRYTPDTASIVLSDYLREYVFKLKNKVAELSKIEESGDSTQKEKIKARKEIDKIEQIISELEYWERDALYPTATQKLSIDLDDGVKVNYAKFSKVLKRIPGLE